MIRKQDVSVEEVFELLQRTIPEGEVARLRKEYRLYCEENDLKPEHPTGGNIYYPGGYSDITSYNNTRADEQEILAWLQRALELTY